MQQQQPNCYGNLSFIITTNRPTIKTLESIPQESEIIIANKSKRGTAQNEGILQSTRDWIVICDDDIFFRKYFLNFVLSISNKNRIIGLEAYYPSPFIIARFMMFHRTVFTDVGDFVERNHGFETEWCMRAVKKGYNIIRVPREGVLHYPHIKNKPASGDGMNLLWLISKHPGFILYILKLSFMKIQKSSYDEEYVR